MKLIASRNSTSTLGSNFTVLSGSSFIVYGFEISNGHTAEVTLIDVTNGDGSTTYFKNITLQRRAIFRDGRKSIFRVEIPFLAENGLTITSPFANGGSVRATVYHGNVGA